MKKLTIAFLLLSSIAHAQLNPPDSVRIQHLENAFINLRTNCNYSHREHQAGAGLWVAGLFSVGTSFLIDDSKTAIPFAIGGGVLSIVGMTIIFDSHKWVGRIADIPLRGNYDLNQYKK